MKLFLAVLLFLLATSVVAEIEQPYLIVVGKDAPASDVVLGANFAAYIKGTIGVTFSSALDSDMTNPDFNGMTIVVIDGKDNLVKIIGTSNAAAAANIYFTQKGFKVREIAYPTKDDVIVSAPPANTPLP